MERIFGRVGRWLRRVMASRAGDRTTAHGIRAVIMASMTENNLSELCVFTEGDDLWHRFRFLRERNGSIKLQSKTNERGDACHRYKNIL
jgi:hypothetical protein